MKPPKCKHQSKGMVCLWFTAPLGGGLHVEKPQQKVPRLLDLLPGPGSHLAASSPAWVPWLCLHLDPAAILLQSPPPSEFGSGVTPRAQVERERERTEMKWKVARGKGEGTSTKGRKHWSTHSKIRKEKL